MTPTSDDQRELRPDELPEFEENDAFGQGQDEDSGRGSSSGKQGKSFKEQGEDLQKNIKEAQDFIKDPSKYVEGKVQDKVDGLKDKFNNLTGKGTEAAEKVGEAAGQATGTAAAAGTEAAGQAATQAGAAAAGAGGAAAGGTAGAAGGAAVAGTAGAVAGSVVPVAGTAAGGVAGTAAGAGAGGAAGASAGAGAGGATGAGAGGAAAGGTAEAAGQATTQASAAAAQQSGSALTKATGKMLEGDLKKKAFKAMGMKGPLAKGAAMASDMAEAHGIGKGKQALIGCIAFLAPFILGGYLIYTAATAIFGSFMFNNPGGSSGGGGGGTAPPSSSSSAIVNAAMSQLGKLYIHGAGGLFCPPPPIGCNNYDCSGLTQWAIYWGTSEAVSLPRVSSDQCAYSAGTRINSASDLQPGDLVCFGSPVYHVGIYTENGKFIHSPCANCAQPYIRVNDLSTRSDFVWGMRF